MKEDHAGETHWKEYRKSDKLNAIGNKNEEFRAGYWYAVETLGYDAHKVIADEHALRTEMESNFEEWLRGFWAAGCQMAAAGIKKRRKR